MSLMRKLWADPDFLKVSHAMRDPGVQPAPGQWVKPPIGFGNEPLPGGNPYAEPAGRTIGFEPPEPVTNRYGYQPAEDAVAPESTPAEFEVEPVTNRLPTPEGGNGPVTLRSPQGPAPTPEPTPS